MTEQGEAGLATRTRPQSLKWIGMAAIVSAVALVVWHTTFSNGFVWYDVPSVAANLALRDGPVSDYFADSTTSVAPGWPGVTPVFRPLRSLSYRLDFLIGGALNSGMGHAHNLFLHLVNAMLILALAHAIGIGPLGSLFVALLFLVHPVQSEAVCWLVCRDVLLATTLTLVGLIYALRRVSRGWRVLDAVVLGVLYMAACLASPQAILFPAWVAMLVFATHTESASAKCMDKNAGGGSRRAVVWSAVAVSVTVAVLYVWWSLTVVAGSGQEPNDILGGWKVKLLAVPRFIGLLLAPVTLTPDYSDMGTGQGGEGVLMVLGGLLVAFVLFLIVRCWPVQPALAAALSVCWFGIVAAWRLDGAFFGERILYMPMVGFALAAGLLAQRLAAVRMKVVGIAVGVILVLAAGRTMARALDWSNDEKLLRPALEYSPGNKAILRQLMRRYFAMQDFDRAIVVADGLLDETPAGPGFGVLRAEPLRVKGMSMISTGAVERGLAFMEEAIAADPYYGMSFHDMGLREMRSGRPEAAIPLMQNACKLMPDDGPSHEQLGIVLENAGRLREGELAFRRAVEVEWGAPSAARRLAVMLIRQGRMKEAAVICRYSLRRFPGDTDLKMWLEKASEAQR
jgi:tetratricopeptide (TPR) repeat protein